MRFIPTNGPHAQHMCTHTKYYLMRGSYPEQFIRGGSPGGLFGETLVNETGKSGCPLLGLLQPRRRVTGDEEQGTHGVHTTQSCGRRGVNNGHVIFRYLSSKL